MQGKLHEKLPKTKTCAEIVEQVQAENGLNDHQMAKALGVTPQAIGYWRRGENEPSGAQIERIVHEFPAESWQFEMAAAFAEAQCAAIRRQIREATA